MTFRTFLPHLIEIRKRLIRTVILFAALFSLFIFFSGRLFEWVATPMLAQNEQVALIATQVITPLTTPLKLAFFCTLMCLSPYLIYQFWAFIAPGLYPAEKHHLKRLCLFSYGLFVAGGIFAYQIVCPMTLGFLQAITPSNVQIMTDIHHYLDFVLALTFSFGLCFQVPLVTYASLKIGLCSVTQLKAKRPYIIVSAFVVGMVLTPPDLISQILLALPLWALFEVGLLAYQWSAKSTNLPSSQLR